MNFNDIPIEDIKYLLSNQPLKDNIYLQAWNYLLTHPNINVPKSIADWITVYNLQNRFKDLPNEIIAKILSDLDYQDLLSICNLSTQFKYVCDNYLKDILKEKLTEKGYYVKNISNINQLIYTSMVTKLNNRCVNVEDGYLIIGTNGKLYYHHGYKDVSKWSTEIIDIDNAVGLSRDNDKIFILCSDQKIHVFGDNQILLKNIIQVNNNNFLDINGNVYGDKSLKHIIKMVGNTLFLDKNGQVYDNDLQVINSLKNIKDIYADDFYCFINDQDEIYVARKKDLNNLKYIVTQNNIKRITVSSHYLIILLNDGVMTVYDFINGGKFTSFENVKDFQAEDSNKIIFLTEDNYLHTLVRNTESTEHVEGNVKFLGYSYVLIDNNIFFVVPFGGKLRFYNIIFNLI